MEMSALSNNRHERFCIGIAGGQTAENAYIEAGYSPRGAAQSASRLLRNADIRARIDALQETIADQAMEAVALTKSYVIQGLMTIADQCMQAKPIRDRSGAILGYSPYKPMAAIRALELLGKELGMFAPPQQRKPTRKFETTEELEQRLAEVNREIEATRQRIAESQRRKRRRMMH